MSNESKRPNDVPRKSTIDGTLHTGRLKRISAVFYRTESASEPLRYWLKLMAPVDRRAIGEDIATVEFGWPVGMPTCRPLGQGLNEVRTSLSGNRIARIFFYVDRLNRMVLLHGIVKKTRATPDADLALARANQRKHERGIR